MRKSFRAKPRLVHRISPYVAVLAGLAAIGAVALPMQEPQTVVDGEEPNWFEQLLGETSLGNAVSLDGEVKQFTFQYASGDLVSLGSAGYPGEADFEAQSTSMTGDQARFDLVAEGKTLKTKTAPYAEALTYFLVTVPMGGADTLVVTVGAAVLEVGLE